MGIFIGVEESCEKKTVSIKDWFYSSFENLFPNFIKHTFRPFSIFYFYLLFDRLKNIWNIHRRRRIWRKKKKCIDQGIDSNNPLSKIYFNFSSLCIKYFCFVSKISNIWNIHRVRRRRIWKKNIYRPRIDSNPLLKIYLPDTLFVPFRDISIFYSIV